MAEQIPDAEGAVAREQWALVERVASGDVDERPLTEHLRRLADHPDPRTAHRWAREALGAFFDAGAVPAYAMPDLARLARAAGTRPDTERRFVAERLLRDGLLPRAPIGMWAELGAALRDLARDDEAFELLLAARPAPGPGTPPDVHARTEHLWRLLVGRSGAGRLPRDWYRDIGPLHLDDAMGLAYDAGAWAFPPPDPRFAVDADPVACRENPRAHPLSGTDALWPSFSAERGDLLRLAARLGDPEKEHEARRDLDAYIRAIGRAANIDYPSAVRKMMKHGPVRRVLEEQFAEWREECAAGRLDGLAEALPRLAPVAEAVAVSRRLPMDADAAGTGLVDGVAAADPVDAAWRALRAGLPEEFRPPEGWVEGASAALHGDFLTFTSRMRIAVHGPGGPVHEGELPFFPGSARWFSDFSRLVPWFDGTDTFLSCVFRGRPTTLRVAGNDRVEIPAGERLPWPQSATSVPVTFPGAAEPVRVALDRGVLEVRADGRTVTRRRAFTGVPPGFWPHLAPADPDGSAALRRVERGTVRDLVGAALIGEGELDAELARVLPEITDPVLRDTVRAMLAEAARLVLLALRLCDALGREHPAGLPGRVRSASGLRAGRRIDQVPAVRRLAEVLGEAAASGPAPDAPVPLDRAVPPMPNRLLFGTLGGEALRASRPWSPDFARAQARDLLGALGDTPWGDGSGRWRRLQFRAMPEQAADDRVWRTPDGAMLTYGSEAIEYSPDAVFRRTSFAGWTNKYEPRPQGWGGADRIARFLRLLDERGPAPYDVRQIHRLADATGLRLHTAASAAYGFPYTVGREREAALLPAEVAALYHDPETGELAIHESWQLDDALREVLMPDDPEDLWTGGLAVDKAVEWWDREGRHRDWPGSAYWAARK
ncbi:hypothetical protein [Actinomadura rifamycini]|uniref:hypothetical protein n=1 Tax=Actinomadura rifamycini TaxID=31962 RepID=UPI00041B5074|nr:hypothetical protein [Actinomadura rifamycini]